MQQSFDHCRLRLDERKHLGMGFKLRCNMCMKEHDVFTSSGFLLRKTALIFAKCDAMIIWVFMSSGGLSRTVSQNGINNFPELLRHVSTMVHISLHSTSVATYGYLPHDTQMRHILA